MGHDHHFLSRLDRVSRDETDFALSLYRDHETVRSVLERARVPESAERIALALTDDDAPAHLIVARDGGFVTCLGRGMSIGERPRVRRSELDRLIEQSRECRQRWAALREEDSLYWFYRRLRAAGPRIAREDFLPYVQIAPVVSRAYRQLWVENLASLIERLRAAYAEARKARPDEDYLHRYWKDYHLVEHLTVLVAQTPESVDALLRDHPVEMEQVLALFWAVVHFGLVSSVTRVAWAAARVGPMLAPGALEYLGDERFSYTLAGWAMATSLILAGETDLEAQARPLVPPLVPPAYRHRDPTVDDLVRDLLLVNVPLTTRTREVRRRAALDAARDRLVLTGPDGVERDLPPDDPNRLGPAIVGTSDMDVLEACRTGFEPLVLGAPHLVVQERAEMLYPPRAWLDTLVAPFSVEAVRTMVGNAALDLGHIETARNAATVGRNERCPCESGKKFKKCCGR